MRGVLILQFYFVAVYVDLKYDNLFFIFMIVVCAWMGGWCFVC